MLDLTLLTSASEADSLVEARRFGAASGACAAGAARDDRRDIVNMEIDVCKMCIELKSDPTIAPFLPNHLTVCLKVVCIL